MIRHLHRLLQNPRLLALDVFRVGVFAGLFILVFLALLHHTHLLSAVLVSPLVCVLYPAYSTIVVCIFAWSASHPSPGIIFLLKQAYLLRAVTIFPSIIKRILRSMMGWSRAADEKVDDVVRRSWQDLLATQAVALLYVILRGQRNLRIQTLEEDYIALLVDLDARMESAFSSRLGVPSVLTPLFFVTRMMIPLFLGVWVLNTAEPNVTLGIGLIMVGGFWPIIERTLTVLPQNLALLDLVFEQKLTSEEKIEGARALGYTVLEKE